MNETEAFTLVVLRWKKEQPSLFEWDEYFYHAIATNLKIGVGIEQMPCGELEANAMYFSVGVLTCNLMIAQKYFVIQEGYQNCTIATLRWKLVQIAARIAKYSNRVRLKIATTVKKFNHYIRMIKKDGGYSSLTVLKNRD
ncbi:hypothetical protein JZK55_23090 [Dissulfurispira thermophila]|uniref:Uncharacterized protein n=1 Tax=Dissulfurispira thermophila TaxID=2715679 RepID=A0A7G1H6K6_9BACT|nr:transposase [Dissulfurispira thermophila]BCB97387.1 hypothetical protein JZK55_23090 [Dissulfurispira thermophila]